nr:hypothetical protein Iba_chr04bCG4190 [Ipomoea batatas]
MEKKHSFVKRKDNSANSIYNEIHEMKNLLCCPAKLRHSQFNSYQLNKSNGGDEAIGNTE